MFTVNPERDDELEKVIQQIDCEITQIGTITHQTGMRVFDSHKKTIILDKMGYQHFKSS